MGGGEAADAAADDCDARRVRGGGHGEEMTIRLVSVSRKREAYQMWRLGFQGQ